MSPSDYLLTRENGLKHGKVLLGELNGVNQLLSEAQDTAANVTVAKGKAIEKSHTLAVGFKLMVSVQTNKDFGSVAR